MSLADEAVLEAKRRVLGCEEPRCSWPGCVEVDPRALTGAAPDILCVEHRTGHWLERQHVAGQHNGRTIVWLPANWHAVLTQKQQTVWPRELLRNPEADPLLRAVACVRGSRETIAIIVERPLGTAEKDLIDVREFLCARIGDRWVDDFRAWQRDRDRAP